MHDVPLCHRIFTFHIHMDGGQKNVEADVVLRQTRPTSTWLQQFDSATKLKTCRAQFHLLSSESYIFFMSLLYCDTETTGFSTKDSAPFEIAFIFVSTTKNGEKYEVKRGFRLNPLNERIKYHEQAFLTHGVTEETIRSYPPPSVVIPQIKSFLKSCSKGYGICFEEKPYLTGYNIDFDYRHVKKLLSDYDVSLNNYISSRHLDVMHQVQSAKGRGVLRGIENCKQSTVAEFLGIENLKTHSAAGDVTTTREITKILHEKGIKLY